MVWQIEFTPEAEKQLSKIDGQIAKRIVNFLKERIATAEDPRSMGKMLKGVLREFWRYRVGDYRIVTRLKDEHILILVVRVAHRREVYRVLNKP